MPIPLILAAMAAAGGLGTLIGNARREGQANRNPLADSEDATTVDPGEDGLFNSVLETIGRPGHAINDALVGNWEGAGRQLVDLGGDIVDSVLPGDWIHPISRRMDKANFSDVVGGMDPGLGKFAVDVLGGAATDPTMLIPGAAVSKGLGAVGRVAGKGVGLVDKVLPGTEKAVADAGRGLRSMFSSQRMTPEQAAILAKGQTGALEADAGLGAIKAGPVGKLSDDEATIVADILHNRHWNGDQLLGRLAPDTTTAAQRIATHPGVTPENLPLITDAVNQAIEIGQNQARRSGIFAPGDLPNEYLPRSWSGQTEEQALNEALGLRPDKLGSPGAVKSRELLTPEDDLAFMEQNPGVAFERDARKLLAKRAESQGALASRAEIGKALVGPGFAYANPEMKAQAIEKIKEMAALGPDEAEGAKVLLDAFNGLKPRGTITSLLAKANQPFKRAAVAGFVIPKFGADVRNRLSGIWQTISNPEARGATGGMAKRFVTDLGGAVADALGGMKMGSDKFTGILTDWESALGKSGGSADNAIEILKQTQPKAAELIQSGILDGYSRAEDLLAALKKSKWKATSELPQRIMRGLEDRMRLGLGLDLMDQGRSASDAVRIAGDTLYKYGSTSAANRQARDLIPFFQFSAKAIPQQAKFMAEQPGVATAISRAMSSANDPDSPVYPYMRGKLNIPIGQDEQGQQQFVSGFGLPFESLSMVPDVSNDLGKLGRSVERDTVGASQPLLKTAFSAVSGEDPYFQSGFNSYGKMPLLGEAGAAGRAYNLAAGTGLIQGLDSPARLVDKLISGDRGAGTKALDLLTGANVVSVDSNRALQQQLQQQLEMNPEVHSVKSLYSTGGDTATDQMLEQYKRVKERIRAKKKAQALNLGVI